MVEMLGVQLGRTGPSADRFCPGAHSWSWVTGVVTTRVIHSSWQYPLSVQSIVICPPSPSEI